MPLAASATLALLAAHVALAAAASSYAFTGNPYTTAGNLAPEVFVLEVILGQGPIHAQVALCETASTLTRLTLTRSTILQSQAITACKSFMAAYTAWPRRKVCPGLGVVVWPSSF